MVTVHLRSTQQLTSHTHAGIKLELGLHSSPLLRMGPETGEAAKTDRACYYAMLPMHMRA